MQLSKKQFSSMLYFVELNPEVGFKLYITNCKCLFNHFDPISLLRRLWVDGFVYFSTLIEPRHEKTWLHHMRPTMVQISTFIVRCLESIISLVSTFAISRLKLASVAEQAGSNSPWSETPKTGFLVMGLKSGINFIRWKYDYESCVQWSTTD